MFTELPGTTVYEASLFFPNQEALRCLDVYYVKLRLHIRVVSSYYFYILALAELFRGTEGGS